MMKRLNANWTVETKTEMRLEEAKRKLDSGN